MTTPSPASSPKTPSATSALKHLRVSDARAVVQLATQATQGVARIAEGVHQSVWNTLGAPSGKTADRTRGITGLVYKSIQGVTQLLGAGAEKALARLEPLLASADAAPAESPQREAVLAALNGVMGDRLLASHNPLATPMTLRFQGTALDADTLPAKADVTGKVLVLIHGLCMNDLQWTTQHSDALAAELGYTPVYVRYNTGLHTSENGAEFSKQLATLLQYWPVEVTDLTVLAHSMGGLVTRSALQQAQQDQAAWPKSLKNIVFLGTPHHGAPLERAGNWVDVILGATPFSAPFKKLGQLRSAGITDLRYGLVLDADWQGHDRFRRQPDHRTPVPLPETVACFTVAATTAAKRSPVADRLIGDGLVPLPSALGQHTDPQRTLHFPKNHQFIAYKMNHMALLNSPEVTRQLLVWLGDSNIAG
jgi:pimeloyl-ACP methyl ester carboxylesterase